MRDTTRPPVPASADPQVEHLFVYGTLLPGEVRWAHLALFVTDEGRPDTVEGRLYDTGRGYPALRRHDEGTVRGKTFRLEPARRDEALTVLDEVEGAVEGLYRRVAVVTGSGVRAWVYEYGGGLVLEPIPGGDWLTR